jgi:SEC-C motif domain protein
MKLCPCHSKKAYEACCKPYHDGTPAPNALALMRSRYSAYALGLADYIMRTESLGEISNERREEILSFSNSTRFKDLIIREFIERGQTATVTFTAVLEGYSYTEKSSFAKKNGLWLYTHGVFVEDKPPR